MACVVVRGCAFPSKLLTRFHGALVVFGQLEWFRRRYELFFICSGDDAVVPTTPPAVDDPTDSHDDHDQTMIKKTKSCFRWVELSLC